MNISGISNKLAFKSLVVEKATWPAPSAPILNKIKEKLPDSRNYSLMESSEDSDYFLIRTYNVGTVTSEDADNAISGILKNDVNHKIVTPDLLKEYNLSDEKALYKKSTAPKLMFTA